MMHFIFETLLTADLLNINPFDQPAVEQGKILAKKYLEQSKGA
jgi:glucose-6-phosphate isomerase